MAAEDTRAVFQVVDTIVIVLFISVGIIGNLLIILAYILTKKLRTTTNAFIFNVALSDLFVTGFGMATVLANILRGGNALPRELCLFTGWLIVTSCGVSLLSLCLIAFNRYIRICHSAKYNKIFRRNHTVFMILAVWFTAIGVVMLGIFSGACVYRYDPIQWVCTFNNRTPKPCSIMLTAIGIAVPSLLSFLFYIRIYGKLRQSNNRLSVHVNNSGVLPSSARKAPASNRKERRAVFMLFIAFFLFVLVWYPYGIVMIVDSYVGCPNLLIKIVTWLAFSNSCINWIVYGAMNKNFQQGYKNALLFWSKRWQTNVDDRMSITTAPLPTTSSTSYS
ncbi:melatonin receptor type 1A-like [Tubulanus polymorphus]|uniref:melatonin receptor type 1A-like n=1 Tax=Tubulanus polymorphus TaxID=672921 RepID=UPI003DA270F9